MRKKGHDATDHNYLAIRSADEFSATVVVHIIGDKVFVENEDACVILTVDQARRLTYFLQERIIRSVDLIGDGDGGGDDY
jgi:hypothetical protein